MEWVEVIMIVMEEQGLEVIFGFYNMLMDGYVYCCVVDKCLNVFWRLKVRIVIFCVFFIMGIIEIGKLVYKYCLLFY